MLLTQLAHQEVHIFAKLADINWALYAGFKQSKNFEFMLLLFKYIISHSEIAYSSGLKLGNV